MALSWVEGSLGAEYMQALIGGLLVQSLGSENTDRDGSRRDEMLDEYWHFMMFE